MKQNVSLQESVAASIEEFVRPGEVVIAAVSGGVDSVVLLHALHEASKASSFTIHVAHINHGLRGDESDCDAGFIEDLAASLGLDFTCSSVSIDGKRTGIEAAARDARYDALERIAASIGAKHIAVGHNADDVAETFLMNLSRGSGPSGLSSHRRTRGCGSSTIIRPLYSSTRAEIEAYATERGLDWREDSSNTDAKFLRNRVRREVIPLLRDVFGSDFSLTVLRSVGLIEDQCKALEASMESTMESIVENESPGVVVLSASALESVGPQLATEAIRRSTRRLGEHPLSYDDTMRVKRLVRADAGKKETLSRGMLAMKERGRITISTQLHGGKGIKCSQAIS